MKFFIVLALAVAVAAAAPADKDATIVSQQLNNIGVDGFDFIYETSDGKKAQESGVLKNLGSENEALEVQGSFSYVGPDGVTYSLSYTADKDGFHPSAAHLPVAP